MKITLKFFSSQQLEFLLTYRNSNTNKIEALNFVCAYQIYEKIQWRFIMLGNYVTLILRQENKLYSSTSEQNSSNLLKVVQCFPLQDILLIRRLVS